MKFGIFSNGQRNRANVPQSYNLDIREMVTVDRLGFAEVWVSEHTGLPYLPDAVPSAELMIAKAAALTNQIRFGSAVRRIALYPPQMVAIEGAVCDCLSDGRYMLGFGVAPPISNYEHWGLNSADGEEMTVEGIQFIQRCWQEVEPFDFAGKFYTGKQVSIYPKPAQARIPIAVATTRGRLLEMAAEQGFRLLTSQYARAEVIARIAGAFDAACLRQNGVTRRRDVTAVRAVYVGQTDERALAEVEAGWLNHLAYNKKYFAPVFNDYLPKSGSLADVTLKHLMDNDLVFIGSPRTVAESITRLFNRSGGYGTFLMVAGKDWGTADQRDQMYHLFAEAVMPRIAELDSGLDLLTLPATHAA